MSTKNLRKKLPHLMLLLVFSTFCSCSIWRGLVMDGPKGPDFYDYRHFERDTIYNGDKVFKFPYAAGKSAISQTEKFTADSLHCTMDSLVNRFLGYDSQLLIIHDDSIVYDHCVAPHLPGQNATIFSVSKSLTSLLCGIAIDEGYIKSVDDPVTKYMPELRKYNATYDKLKIIHLLNMQAGFDFIDIYSLRHLKNLHKMCLLQYGRNYSKVFRHMRFAYQPGTKHEYNSAVTGLLSLIIERATGRSYADYMSEKVWKPLEMEQFGWVTLDSRKHHHAHGFGGVGTNAYDLAKIGQLYLNKGVWNGKRIVSEDWINHSPGDSMNNGGYHYNWYLEFNGNKNSTFGSFYALGIGRQFIYVYPKKKVVAVMVSKDSQEPNWLWIPSWLDIICNNRY